MNVEENRLQTFDEWPNNAVVTPQRIAKAGFFATKQGTEVECFVCHLKISNWNYGDQAMTRHRALNPQCPFVINPLTSGNVPTVSPVSTVPSSSQLNYKDEEIRLLTFENWPSFNIVTPERLARAGFYFLKKDDNTKCAFCQGIVRAWEAGDDPDCEHKRLFPSCPFVITVISPRLNIDNTRPNNSSDNLQNVPNVNLVTDIDGNLDELGVQKHRGPKRSNYGTIEARLRSFVSWPTELIQTPDILAQAGFYYEGLGDQVRCFHCDGGLRHWDPHDDPWTEHARWFPNCSFMKLVKGQEFVTACALENSPDCNQGIEKIQSSRRRREISDTELQEHMTSPAVMAALNIGINIERVKRAVKQKLIQTGRSYSEPDALVEAALNLQLEEDDNFEMECNSSIRNQVRREIGFVLHDITKQAESAREQTQSTATTGTTAGANICAVEDTSSKARHLEKPVSLEEENRILKEARLCKICMDGEVGIVFLPCGHLATCVNCAPNLEDCPVCRSEIKATVRTFLS